MDQNEQAEIDSRSLGHASASATFDVYGHLAPVAAVDGEHAEPLDLDAIRDQITAATWSIHRDAIMALLAEVERLRAEADRFRGGGVYQMFDGAGIPIRTIDTRKVNP